MESKAKACVYDCDGTFGQNDSFETVSAILCSAKPLISAMFNKNIFNHCVLESAEDCEKSDVPPQFKTTPFSRERERCKFKIILYTNM